VKGKIERKSKKEKRIKIGTEKEESYEQKGKKIERDK
jgi:hypothetical protein